MAVNHSQSNGMLITFIKAHRYGRPAVTCLPMAAMECLRAVYMAKREIVVAFSDFVQLDGIDSADGHFCGIVVSGVVAPGYGGMRCHHHRQMVVILSVNMLKQRFEIPVGQITAVDIRHGDYESFAWQMDNVAVGIPEVGDTYGMDVQLTPWRAEHLMTRRAIVIAGYHHNSDAGDSGLIRLTESENMRCTAAEGCAV